MESIAEIRQSRTACIYRNVIMIYFQFLTMRLLEVTDFKVHNVERTQLWVSARGGSCRSAMRLKLFFPRRIVVLRTAQGVGVRISEREIWLVRVVFLNYSSRLEPVSPKAEYNPAFPRYKYRMESKLQHHNPDHSSHQGHDTNHIGGGGSSSIESGRASRGSRSRSSVTSVRGRRGGNLQRRSDSSKTGGCIGDHAISSLRDRKSVV